VFDETVRKVKTLANERKAPGTYTVQFSMPNSGGILSSAACFQVPTVSA
jgi:hypothetical protein